MELKAKQILSRLDRLVREAQSLRLEFAQFATGEEDPDDGRRRTARLLQFFIESPDGGLDLAEYRAAAKAAGYRDAKRALAWRERRQAAAAR